jgi:hypothetical protein
MAAPKITARKYMGDDAASWAVFVNGRPVFTGLMRREVEYYRKLAAQKG